METIRMIFGFIQSHFFYDLRSAVLTVAVIFFLFFAKKMLKDKCDKIGKSIEYLLGTAGTFVVIFLLV